MESITSVNNPRIVAAAELKQKKYREERRAFLVEGLRAVEEAVAWGKITELFYVPAESERLQRLLTAAEERGAVLFRTDGRVMGRLCDTKTPQGIAAVVKIPPDDISRIDVGLDHAPVLVLDRVQDPGNAGTLIRTADAVGAAGVLFLEGCTDAYSPKTVRASMGSVFHIPVVQNLRPDEALAWCCRQGYLPAAACLEGAENLYRADLNRRIAYILGNEANGISPELQAATKLRLYIPMPGRAESMNVAMAAGILLFEGLRQRLYQ